VFKENVKIDSKFLKIKQNLKKKKNQTCKKFYALTVYTRGAYSANMINQLQKIRCVAMFELLH
jgi:hypothetical protein